MALGTTNISTTLVRNTLGENNNNVFSLATSNLINMWSKYKPTRGVNNGAAIASNTFWKGHDGRCGFDLPIFQSNSGNAGVYSPTTWGYLKPRGGSPGGNPDEPGRLGDFRGYEHSSTLKPPFYSYTGTGGNTTETVLDPVENEVIS